MDPKTIQSGDTRDAIYQDLHSGQLSAELAANAVSARRILDIVMDYRRPESVLDVGCGLGTWLKVAQSRGISDIRGIDGSWLDPSKLQVNASLVEVLDLEKSFDLGRHFDLVICLEVAEHISASSADHFIASLTRHAPMVLFSAAIPHQGGHHHVNEQFLPYWVERFARLGFRPLNVIRGKIWDDQTVLWWLRQNVVLFAEQGLIARDERLRRAVEESAAYPLSLVHPDIYLGRVQMGMRAMAQVGQLTNLKRAQLGLWTQETFYSLYQAGMLQESLGFPPEEVLATYSRASDVLPSRAEALHAAARYSRSLGNYEEGYQYAKRGSAVRMPEAGMFTVSWIYDYGLLEELARNAFCIGRYQECIEACRRLLHEGKVPADMLADVRKIANFAAGAIAGFYIVPNRERPASDKYRKDTEVLEEALRAEDDAFLRARYTFYLALSLNNDDEREKALATSEEAVRLHRELEGHNPDAILPDLASALSNLSQRLSDFDRREEALAASQEAVKLYRKLEGHIADAFLPEFAATLDNLSKLSLASCDKAIALAPDFAPAYANRGWALLKLKRFDEALASCDKAIALAPDNLSAWLISGQVYFQLNRKDKAVSCLEKAIELDASDSRARFASCNVELPIIYREESEVLDSRRNYERKLRSLCDAYESEGLNGDLGRAISTLLPFYLAYQGYCDLDLQTLYGSLVCKFVRRKYSETTLPAPPAAGKPVRVGFVSSFFWNHSNWKIPIKGWISQLDRRRFQIFGYHVGKEWDGETAIAASMCDRFVHGLTTVESWRNEILADAPHVLVYPGLLMEGLTLQLAAQRLAPVQCNSWGHPETSGMPTLDFFISSDLMEPDEASQHYSETLIRLPNLSVYYSEPRKTIVEKKRSEFGLRSDATVFWCGQSLFKYLPQYDFVFADIAARVDNCQFVFVRHCGSSEVTKQFTERLDHAFQLNGLDYSRYCAFLPRLNPQGFITAIGQCDLILDSIGWSGCNSTLESLECDLPIVTFRGSLMRGRHTAAILQMMGVINTIATTIEDYVSIAVRLANNPAERAAVSRSIADAKHRLYRDRACISALEDFLANARQDCRPSPRR